MKNNIPAFVFTLLLFFASLVHGQGSTATLTGKVLLKESGKPAVGINVTLVQLKRTVVTDSDGAYRFDNIPLGTYDLIAHFDRVGDVAKTITVSTGVNSADLELSLNAVSENVTVTASGNLETIGGSYQAVSTVGGIDLGRRNPVSIGEALDNEPGVAKRSFGPASSRPVIRGFDGDRVLILQDGLRVGGISSQSGDEVEPIDVLSLDRVEVLKGPATLLYGSNAIGGVVNGISTNDVFQPGFSGYASLLGGTNNDQLGGSAGLKYGFRDLLFFGNGTLQKANDYRTPAGSVFNSFAHAGNVALGSGWFPRQGWLSFTYGYDQRRYGIPVRPGEVDFESLRMRRHSFELKGGLRNLKGFIESADAAINYNDYRHEEIEFESDENVTEIDSTAFNKNFNYRASFNHRRFGRLSGTFGFSGFTRDYESAGEEAPAPRTRQNAFAVFGYERLDLERMGFQFGGRVEQTSYQPDGGLRERSFTGISSAAGTKISLWNGGTLLANYQHSYRAPALEELYNHGPHPGILVFDIGNENLTGEQSDGIDVSIRHSTERLRFGVNTFFYNIRNFVYTAFTGLTDEESNLTIVNYAQGRSAYFGGEANADIMITRSLWFKSKIDYVRAELIMQNKPLPRIPPLRATIGLDWHYRSFSLAPQVIFASKQDRVFDNETPTAGYVTADVNGSYTFIRGRTAHIISAGVYNLTNQLYRNHLSFLKDFAPEMGRTMRVNYSVRF